MRIARAEVLHLQQREAYGARSDGGESHGVQNVCLVRLETDDGLVGWSDVETQPSIARAVMDAPAQPAFSGLRHVILGRDPREVDALWDEMYLASIYYGRRGVAIQVMSGIVNACFDLVGKATGQPLSMLLGGRRRERVRAYASTLFRDTPEQMADAVRGYLAEGFSAIKFGWGIFRDDLARDVELVAAARAAAGPHVDLMVDAGWMKPGITVRSTIALARALEPYDVTWLEDCLHPEDYRGYETLCRESPIPIAAGEQEATIWGFERLLDTGIAYVQPDLSRCGGLSVAKQIATLAAAREIQVVPHAWLTDLLTATSLHFNAWLRHAAYLEFNTSQGPLARELFADPIRLVDGHLAVPTAPGIGAEPDPDAIERYRLA